MRFSVFFSISLFFLECASSTFVELEQACPREASKKKDPVEYQRCFARIEKLLKFDKSFSTSLESQETRKKLITDITDIFFTKLVWPENNHLLALPEIELPHNQVCLFAPERDSQGCNFHPKPEEYVPTLSQRLVNRILTKISRFSYKPSQSSNFSDTPDMSISLWTRTAFVYPSYSERSWPGRIGALLHETTHQFFSKDARKHIPCLASREVLNANSCDANIKGPWGMNLLMEELFIRGKIQTEDPAQLSSASQSSFFSFLESSPLLPQLEEQCVAWSKINDQPEIPKCIPLALKATMTMSGVVLHPGNPVPEVNRILQNRK